MMLRVEDLDVRYDRAVAVDGAALSVPAGGWVALIGPNGAGKTSLLRAVMGLARHRGRIWFDGVEIGLLPAWERQRRGIGYVPEGRQVFPQMTVEETLRVGGHVLPPRGIAEGLERVFDMFPRLAERRAQAGGRSPAASSRCWRWAAR